MVSICNYDKMASIHELDAVQNKGDSARIETAFV